MDRLILANLKLKPSKCKLLQEKVKFLGSMVSADGIEPDPDKIQAIVDWPQPTNLTELRAFVGLANYYRRHIEGFSNIAKPLSDLTKKNRPFFWGDDQQQAFETLKNRLVNYPVLAPPIEDGKYIVDTDASNFAMGAVLQQEQNGVNRVIAYASKTFDAAQMHYCTTRKELAAVIFALKEFRHYLLGGKRFLLRTDHGALTSLFKVPIPIQQQARYLNILADYNFEIQHRPGTQHGNSDGLSRRPCRNKRCNREDCETFDANDRPRCGNLRSGRNYLKQSRQPARSDEVEVPKIPESIKTDAGVVNELSLELIRIEQQKDPVITKIMELLPEAETRKNVDEFGMGVVHLWSQRQSLIVMDNILYRKFESVEGLVRYYQILVPQPLRMKMLYWVHGDPTSGHFGIAKTADKLATYAYWTGWRKDVELFVRRCDVCCRYRKGPRFPQGEMQNGVGLAPFQKFHVDLTGPHRRSAKGNQYLLTGICCFTKYLITVPIRDKSALTVANALLKHVYLIYGAVELQIHDQGPEFVNSVLSHLSAMLGIQDLKSTAYRPVANAAIERVHRTLNAIFAKTIRENQSDWCERAKYVTFAYNTAKHGSTTFSPFYLVFLREPRVGIDLLLDTKEPAYNDTDEYAEIVRERMQQAYKIVSDQLQVTFERAKRRYDQRVKAVRFKLHEFVWFFCPRLRPGRGRKFRRLTSGPFRIVRILNDVNYAIQKFPNGRIQICHVDRLLKYEGEIPAVWVKYDQEKTRNHANDIVSAPQPIDRNTLSDLPHADDNRHFRKSRRINKERPRDIRDNQASQVVIQESTEGDITNEESCISTNDRDDVDAGVDEQAWLDEMTFQKQRRRWFYRRGYSKPEIEAICADEHSDQRFDVLGISKQRTDQQKRRHGGIKSGVDRLTYRYRRKREINNSRGSELVKN